MLDDNWGRILGHLLFFSTCYRFEDLQDTWPVSMGLIFGGITPNVLLTTTNALKRIQFVYDPHL